MSQVLWVGTRKGLFRIDPKQGYWKLGQESFLGTNIPMVLPDTKRNKIYASLHHGHFGTKLHVSEDNGKNWTETNAPVYPPKPEDVPDVIDQMRNKVIPWSLEQIWCFEVTPKGRIWCGTLPGGLFSSDDGGSTWTLNMPLWSLPNRKNWMGGGYDTPGIHSITIDPRNEEHITVAISCGGVWRSTDNGVTWNHKTEGMRAEYLPPERAFDPDGQDPHRMVQCAGSPDHFWVQHHNGIFKSKDNCESWEEIKEVEPSVFGFAVVVHPKDPETAWFVPAVKDSDRYPRDGKFVVTRTTDGGKNFEIKNNGLPQRHAYHLVYRHCLDISGDGKMLAMGSTTGGLWLSDDGGDNWRCFTQDLPPVYVVRFG